MTYQALTMLRALYRPSDDAFIGDLTAAQRSVLAVLVMHAGDGGTCFPSIPSICRGSGFSRRMVIRTLSELESLKLISRRPRPPRSTLYTVHDLHRAPHAPCTPSTVTVHDVHLDSAPHAPERLIERLKEERDMGDESRRGDDRAFPPLSNLPREGRARIYPPEFEGAFAALPPRHVPHPKAAAYTAWRARVGDVEELFQLEAAAHAYREVCDAAGRSGSEFVMQAARFYGPGGEWEPYSGVQPGASAKNGRGNPSTKPDPLILTSAEVQAIEARQRSRQP